MTRSVWFVADVHLTRAPSAGNDYFLEFLNGINGADVGALFILGDLFDVWVGDDDGQGAEVIAALSELTGRGTALFIQHGNRDFMLGQRFFRACHANLLPEAYVYNDGYHAWLLMHGDSLVADKSYQSYRCLLRNPLTVALAALLPLSLRRRLAVKLRAASRGGVETAMLDERCAGQRLRRCRSRRLIHGHLHKSGHRTWQQAGEDFQRWCLPPWGEEGGGYAELSAGELQLHCYPPRQEDGEGAE